MRSPRRAAIALVALVGCKHAPEVPSPEAGTDAGEPAASVVAASDGGFAPARCALVDGEGARATLRDVGARRGLVVGEAVPAPGGLAVGIVHTPATGLEATVAHIAGGKVAEWTVAKAGELVPDAPPPKPLVAADAVYAAYVGRGAAGDNAALRRLLLKKEGVDTPLAIFPERTTESLAFDASLSADGTRVALAWDDDAVAKGGITVGVVPLGGRSPLAARIVSGETADPDSPRLAPRATGGWWVAWTAHRPEASGDSGARTSGLVEAPAEERVYSWIELAIVGDDGAASGPPRRITSPLGHVASFDLAPHAGAPVRALDIVARDETQGREGEGGRILHVVVSPDGSVEDTSTVVQAGVGRGSVDLLAASGGDAWFAFSGTQDRTLIAPLVPGRGGAGAASIEEVLEGARLLTLEESAEGARSEPARFVAAFPGLDEGAGPLFREVVCAR